MTIKALLLDMDGTIADSLPGLRRAFDTFLARYGAAVTTEEYAAYNGLPLRNIIPQMRERHKLTPPHEQLLAEYLELAHAAHAESLPFDGAERMLMAAYEKNYVTVLVTSSGRQMAERWLARHNLPRYFAHIIAGDNVTEGKPHPEPYLKALELAGASPELSLAVEDSDIGITASLAAGVPSLLLAKVTTAQIGSHRLFKGHIHSIDNVILHL